MKVDPVGGTAGDPQSWNRYAYVRNNPIGNSDPSGLDPMPAPLGVPPWERNNPCEGKPFCDSTGSGPSSLGEGEGTTGDSGAEGGALGGEGWGSGGGGERGTGASGDDRGGIIYGPDGKPIMFFAVIYSPYTDQSVLEPSLKAIGIIGMLNKMMEIGGSPTEEVGPESHKFETELAFGAVGALIGARFRRPETGAFVASEIGGVVYGAFTRPWPPPQDTTGSAPYYVPVGDGLEILDWNRVFR